MGYGKLYKTYQVNGVISGVVIHENIHCFRFMLLKTIADLIIINSFNHEMGNLGYTVYPGFSPDLIRSCQEKHALPQQWKSITQMIGPNGVRQWSQETRLI